MDFDRILRNKSEEELREAVTTFLRQACTPAFGALPKPEMELLLLGFLEQVGALSKDAGNYELVSKLHITNSKARRLIYQRELRRMSHADLDRRVKQALKRPLIQKAGELFVLDIDSPLLLDHLREKVRVLGFVADGSFSPTVVKLPMDAVVALMESCIPEHDRDGVKQALVAAGAPDCSFKGVLKAALGKIAQRVAAEAGEAVMDRASEYLTPILDAAGKRVLKTATEIFAK